MNEDFLYGKIGESSYGFLFGKTIGIYREVHGYISNPENGKILCCPIFSSVVDELPEDDKEGFIRAERFLKVMAKAVEHEFKGNKRKKDVVHGEDITIESDIPPPPPSKRQGQRVKYPFAQLRVGDSFSYRPKNIELLKASQLICSAANAHVKTHAPNKQFTVRLGKGCVRCWRTK